MNATWPGPASRLQAAFLACLASLAACLPDPAPTPGQGATAQPQPKAAQVDLHGRWRILSIDGRPPAGPAEGERAPSLVFSNYNFGGTAGCNDFGGLGLLADGHFAIHSLGSTLIGCYDELAAQERAISQLFFARPRVTSPAPGRVRIESEGHALELERTGAYDSARVPGGPEELAGTSWRIAMMDGQEESTDPAARFLRFGAGDWQGMASCATLSGTWRRDGDRILVGPNITTTEQACPPDMAAIDRAFADLMRSNPRFLVGPNGELLLAGRGHALAGERSR